MSRFDPLSLIPHYQPTGSDVPLEEYAAQLERCQGCRHRLRSRCRLANQPAQLIARKRNRSCPLDRVAAKTPTTMDPRTFPTAEPREVQRLAAVCCHYNPCGYDRLEENYHRFRSALPPDLDLWTVELAYDEQPWRLPGGDRTIRLRGTRDRHVLWQKERMLNVAFEVIPKEYDAVCWLDRDVIFGNSDWVLETKSALAQYSVCQLYERWLFLDEAGRIGRIRPGHVYAKASGLGYGVPGGAWAARREVIAGGIYDRHIVGGGDSVLAWSFDRGRYRQSRPLSPKWQMYCDEKVRDQHALTQGSMTYIGGDAMHLYHGEHINRQYNERYEFVKAGHYDPAVDVEVDPQTGLLQWTAEARSQKPRLVEAVAAYFALRQEDG